MSRLPRLTPDRMSPEQAALYDEIAHGPRAAGPQHFELLAPDGSLNGPFNAFLFSPALGNAIQAVGAAVRFSTALSDRVREMAILVVAAHWGSGFEQHAHESVGAAAGVTPRELAELRDGVAPALEDPVESASLDLVSAMVAGDVTEDDWQRWANVVGDTAVFELSTLVGYYSMLALQLRVFRAEPATP